MAINTLNARQVLHLAIFCQTIHLWDILSLWMDSGEVHLGKICVLILVDPIEIH